MSKTLLSKGVCLALAVAFGLIGPSCATHIGNKSVTRAGLQEAYGKLPLYFIENRGQVDDRVAYYVQGRETSVYFTSDGLTFVLSTTAPQKQPEPVSLRRMTERESPREHWVLKLDFVDANPSVKARGQELTSAAISYFKGPKENWKTGLPTYSQVVYPELWPGIDLVYSGTVNQLKYSFVVKPGADPRRIKLAYRGAEAVRVADTKRLEVITPVASFEDGKPLSYQDVNGKRVEVATAYALEPERDERVYEYGFHVGAYDPSKPLVIDPVILVYAGYIGGSSSDNGSGIAVDSSGNAYVIGSTNSSEASFPVAVGPDLTLNGVVSGFVAKVNATGTALVYAGYIDCSGETEGTGIAVDSGGNAYLTGRTNCNQSSFPVTVGPDLTSNGKFDAFVAKLNAAGTTLLYAGYIGGSVDDGASRIAVDSEGNAYITGTTQSTETTFPVTVGPDLTFNSDPASPAPFDAFVAKVNPAGSALVYAGYIGGSGEDAGRGIAVDSSGNAYVTGYTTSSEATFPATVGPDLTYNGFVDAFVAKVNPHGTALVYAGYIGGNSQEEGHGIAVDSSGNAYITGVTLSNESSFPVTVGPDLTYNDGGTGFFGDAFVAKVNAAGTALVYAGYIGGSGSDLGSGIAVDSFGYAYVTGATNSSEASFPVAVGPNLSYSGGADAFVAKVQKDGSGLLFAGYIGGSGDDRGIGIALDTAGNAYVAGRTMSGEASFPATVGPHLTYNGGQFGDAFVAKIGVSGGFIDPSRGGEFLAGCLPCPPGPIPEFIVGPNILPAPVNVLINVLPTPALAPPRGFSGPATSFVDVILVPNPGTLPASGATIVLPLASPLPSGTPLSLFELDPGSRSFIPRDIVGTVDLRGNTATFSGVTKFSIFVGFIAMPAATSTTISSNPNPSIDLSPVTFQAAVSSAAGTPDGTVTFKDGGATLATVALSSGNAGFTTSALPVGTHSIAAVYSGNNNFLGSNGSLNQQVVYKFAGFFPPVQQRSTFNAGSTIPVKFTLQDANGNGVGTAIPSVSANGGPALGTARFDPSAGQYIFNLGTRGLPNGTLLITIALDDGTQHSVTVTLR